jgi:hypothetical protein
LDPEDAFVKQIPIERLKVSDIKDDAMPFGNRPLIEGVRSNQTEKFITPPAGIRHSLQ